MVNDAQQPQPTKLPTPTGAIVLFVLSPLFVAFGWFLWMIQHGLTFDWAVFQTALGAVLFWLGVMMFFVGCLMVSFRNTAQRQLDILLGTSQ